MSFASTLCETSVIRINFFPPALTGGKRRPVLRSSFSNHLDVTAAGRHFSGSELQVVGDDGLSTRLGIHTRRLPGR